MQITADVSEISKTVQRDLTFILNVLSESSIHFAYFLIVFAKKNVVSFTKIVFIENKAELLCLRVVVTNVQEYLRLQSSV